MSTEESAASHGNARPSVARRPRSRRLRTGVGLVFVLLICAALFQARAWQPYKVFAGKDNVQIAEAQSWWLGRLHLPERWFDTALVEDRAYSHFPPLFSFLAATVVPVFDGVPQWLVFLIIVVPVPVLAFRLFWVRTGLTFPSIVLTVALVCGTSLWPIIDRTLRGGEPYFVNHTLATIGLCIFLTEYFGRRRAWLAGGGLVVAALSRQLTFVYALPLVVMTWKGADRSRGRLFPVAGSCLLIVMTVMGANALKFGHPLDNGYMRIYEGRSDALASFAHEHGLFSVRFLPKNLYYATVGLPKVEQEQNAIWPDFKPNPWGTGILWTTPLLLWLVIDFRRVWRERRNRPLMIAVAAIFAALMCFHTTGYAQRGFNRFSLDYVPALLALLAPVSMKPGRRWISVAMVAWSVVYFRWLI